MFPAQQQETATLTAKEGTMSVQIIAVFLSKYISSLYRCKDSEHLFADTRQVIVMITASCTSEDLAQSCCPLGRIGYFPKLDLEFSPYASYTLASVRARSLSCSLLLCRLTFKNVNHEA